MFMTSALMVIAGPDGTAPDEDSQGSMILSRVTAREMTGDTELTISKGNESPHIIAGRSSDRPGELPNDTSQRVAV